MSMPFPLERVTMRFATSMIDPSSPEPAQPRTVWQQFGDEIVACRLNNAHELDPALEPSSLALVRDLNTDITAEVGDAETLRLIDVAEKRLEQNAELLKSYDEQLAELHLRIGDYEAQVAAATERVGQLIFAEHAYQRQLMQHWQPPEGHRIINRHEVLDRDRWLEHRGCTLGDTVEWRRLDALEKRMKDPRSDETRAVQARTRVQQLQRDERTLTILLSSRVANLQEHLRRLEAVRNEPPPTAGPRNPELRAWLLEQQRLGKLPGELTFAR